MDSASDYLAQRIIKDLDVIFSKDPLITEFGILPVDICVTNKCPVVHITQHVGLESWCIKPVFQYAYRKILEWKIFRKSKDEDLLSWTRAVVLINPDIQVAWNIRKDLIASEKQDIQSELTLCLVVLSRKPKCADVFVHRRWLLEQVALKTTNKKISPELTQIEFRICAKAAEDYPQNYYAWSHRIWVAQKSSISSFELIQSELESMENWTQNHVSDHSGLQYRQFLFSLWVDKSIELHLNEDSPSISEVINALIKELNLNSELIAFYMGHEALWYHRRFVLRTLDKCKMYVPKYELNFNRTKSEIGRNEDTEAAFILRVKAICCPGDRQFYLSARHTQWVQQFLKLH